jgi:hypothetical protein
MGEADRRTPAQANKVVADLAIWEHKTDGVIKKNMRMQRYESLLAEANHKLEQRRARCVIRFVETVPSRATTQGRCRNALDGAGQGSSQQWSISQAAAWPTWHHRDRFGFRLAGCLCGERSLSMVLVNTAP